MDYQGIDWTFFFFFDKLHYIVHKALPYLRKVDLASN